MRQQINALSQQDTLEYTHSPNRECIHLCSHHSTNFIFDILLLENSDLIFNNFFLKKKFYYLSAMHTTLFQAFWM